jgi:hypothetical protein
MIMNAKIQRLAGSWLFPLTLLLLSPIILGTLWTKWEIDDETRRLSQDRESQANFAAAVCTQRAG